MNHERFDNIEDVYEAVVDRARRRDVDPSLVEIKSPADLQRARDLINNTIAQGVLSATDLGRRTGIKQTAIHEFRTDTWRGKQGTLFTVAGQLCAALDQLLAQRRAEETSVTGFVETRFAQHSLALIRYAVERKIPGLLVAPPGCGKTMVMQAAREMFAGSILIVVDGDQNSPLAFLRMWAGALGLSDDGRRCDLRNRIVNCLFGSGRLTLIDEADQLPISTLNTIRQIWDEVKTPIVFAGAPTLRMTLTTRKTGTETAELLTRFYTRVKIYRDLSYIENPETGAREPLFSVADIKKVFQRGQVRLLPESIDMLVKWANTPARGGLRLCATIVQMAVDFYPNDTVKPAHLRSALRMTLGPAAASLLEDSAGTDSSSHRKAATA